MEKLGLLVISRGIRKFQEFPQKVISRNREFIND